MRRIFAFITLALSLLVVVVVGVPTISSSMNKGTDFDGGYNILYHVTNADGVEYKGDSRDSVMDTAAKYANDRLNTLNITNPEVAVANDNYLSITIQDLSDDQLDVVRYALANNSEVTLRDTDDNWLGNGSEIFENITLTSSGDSVTLALKVKDSDKLKEATEEIAANYTTDDDGNGEVNLVMWIGYQETYDDELKEDLDFEGDHYSDIGSNMYARFKILTALSIDEALTDSFSCTANVLDENVQLMNKLLEQDSVHYVLAEVSTNQVGSFYKSTVPTFSIYLGIIGIAIICALFIIFYKFSGVASALSIIVYGVLTLLLYNTFGGLFGLETIIALAVGVVLSVDANVVFLERIKDEIRKGKEISRSFDEGAKKSVSTVLDANVLVLIAAFALYLFGTQVIKSFSAVLIISEVIIICIVVFVTRFMISLLCHAKVNKNAYKLFGVKEDEISDLNDYSSEKVTKKSAVTKIKFDKNPKFKFKVTGIVCGLGLIVGLVMQLINGSFFNYPENLRNGSRFYFTTYDQQFSTEESTIDWFENITDGKTPDKVVIRVDTESFTLNEMTQIQEVIDGLKEEYHYTLDLETNSTNTISKYTVSVYYNNEIDNTHMSIIDEVFEDEADSFLNEEDEIDILDMNYSSGNYDAYSGGKAILRGLLVLGIVCLFMFIYLSIRFSISYSISAICSLVISEVLLFALIALSRIQIGVEAVAIGLGLAILSINTNSITFDRLRESISESNGVVWTKETRLNYAAKAISDTSYGHFVSAIAALVLGLLLTGTSFVGVFSGIGFVFAVVCYLFTSLFITPHIWAYVDTVYGNIKDKSKQRRSLKKKDEDVEEVSEYVFFGIND